MVVIEGGESKELTAIAASFNGLIDEVSVYSNNLEDGVTAEAAISKVVGPKSDEGRVAHIVFKSTDIADGQEGTAQVSIQGGDGSYTLVPYAAPWTPAVITSVTSGEEDLNAHAEATLGDYKYVSALSTSPPYPHHKMTVTGSNFANSPMLECMWGESKVVNEDAKNPILEMQAKYKTKAEYISDTMVYCPTPKATAVETLEFAVGSPYFLNTIDHFFTDAALECDGQDDYLTGATIPKYVSATGGNTWSIGMWVLPYAAPVTRTAVNPPPPPPPHSPRHHHPRHRRRRRRARRRRRRSARRVPPSLARRSFFPRAKHATRTSTRTLESALAMSRRSSLSRQSPAISRTRRC